MCTKKPQMYSNQNSRREETVTYTTYRLYLNKNFLLNNEKGDICCVCTRGKTNAYVLHLVCAAKNPLGTNQEMKRQTIDRSRK